MPERCIYLGMPGYGSQTAAAARSFYRACRDDTDGRRCPDNEHRDKIYKENKISSLLAANMNSLWASARTKLHRGQRVDYFAMLHDDIGCEDWWLDKLIDELEAQDLDILGVVSPIKDARGVTSTAIADPGDDPWNVVRLTMDEVYRLPPTFTSEHVGGDLLLNTACWVCRFDKFAEYTFYFTINDEITFDPELDCYVANVESEDWFFSRLCHQAGMKVGATRKIALFHEGNTKYVNTIPWGSQTYDVGAVDKSPISERADGFKFPGDVEGWLAFYEGETLFNLARGKRVLEIGSYCGRSTICLAQSAESVVAVDPHDSRNTLHKPRYTAEELEANLERYGVRNKVSVVVGTVEDLEAFDNYEGYFDIAFIDGNHDEPAVQNDVDHALRSLKPDGLFVFHDFGIHAGVKQAIDELLADGGELLSVHGTLAVVKASAAIPLEV
jgi:SAM-dependent methyltransferase